MSSIQTDNTRYVKFTNYTEKCNSTDIFYITYFLSVCQKKHLLSQGYLYELWKLLETDPSGLIGFIDMGKKFYHSDKKD